MKWLFGPMEALGRRLAADGSQCGWGCRTNGDCRLCRLYTDYSFQVELTSGAHSIGVAFLNDAYNPGVEDRNLYLDKFMIYSPPGIAKPELAGALVIEAEDATIKTAGGAIKWLVSLVKRDIGRGCLNPCGRNI